jgi:HEPN domain-containing protein
MRQGSELAIVVEKWVRKADHDFRSAIHLLSIAEDCPYDTICFHAQQSVEKLLKAYLIAIGADAPRTHDLVDLATLIPNEYQIILSTDDLALLNPYSIESRYPGFYEEITRLDSERALAAMTRVREVLLPSLKKIGFSADT